MRLRECARNNSFSIELVFEVFRVVVVFRIILGEDLVLYGLYKKTCFLD